MSKKVTPSDSNTVPKNDNPTTVTSRRMISLGAIDEDPRVVLNIENMIDTIPMDNNISPMVL